eukprot:CAMPEP_0116916156 /NCGR_PEP_ID=MMETSP0467-20121206/18359_1 /TAXON_ID=283647 /ORGANISM="Mesodinium pulex, Strain SPMC105" /LENGTH=52 /DNA_ID=CAMNT_0004592963 /DNA_START=463 /DNA_END=621 /DNA_ORIENTATION=+
MGVLQENERLKQQVDAQNKMVKRLLNLYCSQVMNDNERLLEVKAKLDKTNTD